MKIIAHRGLQNGPNKEIENHPGTIEHALALGFDVEADAWFRDGNWYLGHDEPQYLISESFLERDKIWVHCKTPETLYAATDRMHYFFHNEDDLTLTSKGVVWVYPGKFIGPWKRAVAVLPETVWDGKDFEFIAKYYKGSAYAICTDFSVAFQDILEKN